jgi:hypothetical protein
MYITLRDFVTVFLHIVLLNMIRLKLLVWLVLVQIGPPCPRTHSRLILSLPSAAELFIEAFTFFPRVPFALAALVRHLA